MNDKQYLDVYKHELYWSKRGSFLTNTLMKDPLVGHKRKFIKDHPLSPEEFEVLVTGGTVWLS